MQLKFDLARAKYDFYTAVSRAATKCLEEMYSDIYRELATENGRNDLEKLSKNEERYFTRQIIGGAYAVMDSYGTGSEMDDDNPFLSQYINSSLWNPARINYDISGRPKGFYINILGRKRYSSGRKAGRSLEDRFSPQKPSFAFQRAEKWYFAKQSRVNEILTEYIDKYIDGMANYLEYK